MRGRQRNAAQPSPRKLASPPGRKRALRRLGAGIEEKLLLNGVRRTGWCPMTATSPGTPLIVIVLALGISFLSAMVTARARAEQSGPLRRALRSQVTGVSA
jgi:hypothetical protein